MTYDKEGQVHGLKYQMLTPFLVKYIQMQQEAIDALKAHDAQKTQNIADIKK